MTWGVLGVSPLGGAAVAALSHFGLAGVGRGWQFSKKPGRNRRRCPAAYQTFHLQIWTNCYPLLTPNPKAQYRHQLSGGGNMQILQPHPHPCSHLHRMEWNSANFAYQSPLTNAEQAAAIQEVPWTSQRKSKNLQCPNIIDCCYSAVSQVPTAAY